MKIELKHKVYIDVRIVEYLPSRYFVDINTRGLKYDYKGSSTKRFIKRTTNRFPIYAFLELTCGLNTKEILSNCEVVPVNNYWEERAKEIKKELEWKFEINKRMTSIEIIELNELGDIRIREKYFEILDKLQLKYKIDSKDEDAYFIRVIRNGSPFFLELEKKKIVDNGRNIENDIYEQLESSFSNLEERKQEYLKSNL